eukprot:gene51160-62561_t
MDVTLTTAVLVTRAYLPGMLAAGQGRVVMMASVTGPMVSNPGESAYSAAKAAMVGLTHALALEVAAQGVTVNAVAPGWIATEAATPEELRAATATPPRRAGTPAEVAACVAFLASPGMTPAARLSAAITVLDRILGGEPVEQALTNWGRASRFAGSGDRHAVRDLVFDALRCKRSFAALGGALTGRGLILGGLRAAGADVAALFSGEGHAPARVSEAEAGHAPIGAEALDVPDWLCDMFVKSLAGECDETLEALRHRAP